MSSIRFFSVIRDTTDQARITAGWSRKREHFYLKVQATGKTPDELLSTVYAGENTLPLARSLEDLFGIVAPAAFWQRVEEQIADDDFEFPTDGWEPEVCAYCKTSAIIPGIVFPLAPTGETPFPYVQRCEDCKLVSDDMAAAFILSIYLEMPIDYGEGGRPYIKGITFDRAGELTRQSYKI